MAEQPSSSNMAQSGGDRILRLSELGQQGANLSWRGQARLLQRVAERGRIPVSQRGRDRLGASAFERGERRGRRHAPPIEHLPPRLSIEPVNGADF